MAKFRITSHDGATYEITAPDDATQDQVQAYVQQNIGSLKPTSSATAPAGPTDEQRYLSNPAVRLARGGKDGIDGLAQLTSRLPGAGLVNSAADAAGQFLNQKVFNRLGLPGDFAGEVLGIRGAKPEQLDKEIRDANSQYEAARQATAPKSITSLVTGQSADPGFDWIRMGGNIASPTNVLMPGGAAFKGATTLPQLAAAGAKAGAFGAMTQPVLSDPGGNFWADKALQAGLGAAGGAALTPALAKGAEGVASVASKIAQRAAPQSVSVAGTTFSPQQIEIALQRVFQSQGVDPAQMPQSVLASVRQQIGDALTQRAKLDPAAALRRAQAEAIGLTGDAGLTQGQMMRDPMRFAQEKNLSGVRIDTPSGPMNPMANRFTAQNAAMQGVFDNAGARSAMNPAEAGPGLMDALRAADAPVKRGVDDLYARARGMNEGRAADLDRAAFSQAVNQAIDEGMWGHMVPPEARGFINDITGGKVPFNVESATMIDSRLSALQRAARRQGNEGGEAAIGLIRQHLHDAPFAAPAAEVRSPSIAEAANAAGVVDNGISDVPFREIMPGALPSGQRALPGPGARAVSTGSEFDMPPRGGGPAMLEGPAAQPQPTAGEAAREAFNNARRAAKQRFSDIEATPAQRAALDGDAADNFVNRYVLNATADDLRNLRARLANDPQAVDQIRAQIASHLKRAAFGENQSGDAGMSAERFARTLRTIGPDRLRVFFSPEEVMRFNLAAKVGSDMESIPSGARYAVNKSGTGAAAFNLLQGLANAPGVGKIPGIGMLRDQLGKAQAESAVRQALLPGSAATPAVKQASQLTPEQVRALQLLLAPPAIGVGSAAGSGF